MASKPVNFGSSLAVPNVQELMKVPINTIPPRYIRTDQDPPIISGAATLPAVPVIDLQKLLAVESSDLERARLHSACQEWGFFQLLNHGVSSSLVKKTKLEIQEFFKLPIEEKRKFWQQPGALEGFGQAFVVSEEQKLDWGDRFYIQSHPTYIRQPHLFPKLPIPFRDTLDVYSLEMKKLAMALLEQMGKALTMETGEITKIFDDGLQGMRMNYYPPCPRPEQVIGLSPHSDAVGITILLQLNELEGLQIKKDGNWIPVKPLPDSFIVNIGDIMEIVSNGIYRSIEHRATVNSEKERLSMAIFCSPNPDGEVGPARSLIGPGRPALFRREGVADYFKALFARKLDGKSYIEAMRIQNGEGGAN
ncbi:protein SRG1-like [Macadamia integrifolia]|uniref:protein SRG1-like n=1 Tax=Macadamia integrifolia TaxID=60698 RepID=UPI001C53291C|nr:protein SRG1-like [Macadamia integrifolia]